ncbi:MULTISPECIES: hypothetical protein [Paenibacillus]|uniref:Uncharacterized protein n=1 Tax=Paenibacillus polymyxa (strain SC2) TaxID=886882 RepID=E3E8N8_PAEPS|nr:hypothetical protein [Paenibacillus polymyxa]ADO57747.1 hypothetical protein PPSC2_17730 [Paenibacillus polymyxa SC2]WPQ55486.1 hypothetical protein SKN87_18045 [Paenibacillus polymyxa]CCI70379.1 hypothetical protein PPM_3570 [Paenibacillus polymyxa M1]
MMTNNDYKLQVEKELGKELKEIMYEYCVEKDLIPAEISSILNVPKNTIIQWRNQFRFGPQQRAADSSRLIRQKGINDYKNELQNIDFNREFDFKEHSLSGFKELIERFLELEKYRRTIINSNALADMSVMIRIESLNEMLGYLNDYEENQLYKRYEQEIQNLEMYKDLYR